MKLISNQTSNHSQSISNHFTFITSNPTNWLTGLQPHERTQKPNHVFRKPKQQIFMLLTCELNLLQILGATSTTACCTIRRIYLPFLGGSGFYTGRTGHQTQSLPHDYMKVNGARSVQCAVYIASRMLNLETITALHLHTLTWVSGNIERSSVVTPFFLDPQQGMKCLEAIWLAILWYWYWLGVSGRSLRWDWSSMLIWRFGALSFRVSDFLWLFSTYTLNPLKYEILLKWHSIVNL